jgi:polyphosphate kinase
MEKKQVPSERLPKKAIREPTLKLPARPASNGYVRTPRESQTFVPDHAAVLMGG